MGRLQHSLSDAQLEIIKTFSILLVGLTLVVMYKHYQSMQRRYGSSNGGSVGGIGKKEGLRGVKGGEGGEEDKNGQGKVKVS
ncbi:hypothetical protein I302_107754 [Kwoniella bestiolae CBS 10118]|uniref:Uncharacterized protein n=1 Tax=Kwoniella bestiolae CBS 10118 TaxID=1296100 RepID=A0A1B9FXN2_9TREE|nr:hypothetical protein I302_06507 [Kwoniella bestiolae CBS 10118]OCF23524.1 hypothetical protein I302_06507 [Kwoniella bestiolae CBS 10118]